MLKCLDDDGKSRYFVEHLMHFELFNTKQHHEQEICMYSMWLYPRRS